MSSPRVARLLRELGIGTSVTAPCPVAATARASAQPSGRVNERTPRYLCASTAERVTPEYSLKEKAGGSPAGDGVGSER